MPMTLWLLLMAPYARSLRDFLINIPIFLALDGLRALSVPRAADYVPWLKAALGCARGGAAIPGYPRWTWQLLLRYGFLSAWWALLILLILTPRLRHAVADSRFDMLWRYFVSYASSIYSYIGVESAYLNAAGKRYASFDVELYYICCLIQSIGLLFLYTGPTRAVSADAYWIGSVPRACIKGRTLASWQPLLMSGLILVTIGQCFWIIFHISISYPSSARYYIQMILYPPVIWLSVFPWIFSAGITMLSLYGDQIVES
jgi:hypothetical protein